MAGVQCSTFSKMDSCEVVAKRKADVAVVKPRVSDHVEQVCCKTLDLSKVIRLLEDPLTVSHDDFIIFSSLFESMFYSFKTSMQDRHVFVLKKVLRRRHAGFLLRELASISRILDACAEKAKDHAGYSAVLCEALQICRLPFLKERVSDELIYAQDVKRFLSHMGYLMRVPDGEVRRQVVESVKSFYICCVAPSKHTHHGPQPTSPGYRLQLLERSDLAQTLFLSMAALEEQPAIKLLLLQTLQILSSSSDMNCALMLSARGAETICLHMNQHDPSRRILFHSSEILWNLLERGSKAEVATQLSSMECAISLKEAFLDLLLNGFRHADIQVRNDLLVLTTLFADNSSSLLVESFFAKQLIAIGTFPELKSSNPVVAKLKLSCSMEDLQMKKLLLNLLLLMAKDSAAIQIFKEEQVMLALLTLIKPPAAATEVPPRSCHWSSVQQEELQLHALAVLATVAPLMLDQYMSCYGNVVLLHLLDWCSSRDAFFGQGHGFHATGGRGGKKAHMRYCIRLMRSVTSLAEKTLNQDLCDQGTIHLLLGLLMQMEASRGEEDAVTVEMKSDMQLIMCALCEGDVHRKELFGCEGVEMVVHFLRRGSGMFYSGLGHNKLLLSTLLSVRLCIVGCYTTEDYFLSREGAKVLLDLLSSSPKCVHGVILATLLELFDNLNTLPHVLSWRHGRSGRTAPGLLLHVWRREEAELGVGRNQCGGIEDPKQSVLGHRQLEEAELTSTPNAPSAAVLEIQENLLAKIYLIFCKMGFQDLPGLSVKDQVTLCIVKRYLDFKVGEVWDEIGRELSLEGVRPVTPDQETLRVARQVARRTAEAVAAEQEDGLRWEAETAGREEELAYEEMKSHWKQRQLTAKSWSDFVCRTSNYDTLKEIKEQRHKYAEMIRTHNQDVAPRPEELFVSQVMVSEDSVAAGTAGIKMAKIPVMAAAHKEVLLSERERLRSRNTLPVKD
ncbi:cilia- and flagella-associated protein 69-like isoform X2 [Dunckerocampus dactyliophorus]|uniref:cilia- and flagella-associated protein 69-like isoform X2 n=1 Tax=Dunckerocampus dactyliophorus TaxID=161453 RepID=UPI00240591C6|nr:cilia- and flagella-associated protein 69-like isoform X2 [Dunckerocampus dactyliophorus]